MNAYVNGVHERQIRDVLTKEMPNIPVSISSEVLPEMYEYERALTTVRADSIPYVPSARAILFQQNLKSFLCWVIV